MTTKIVPCLVCGRPCKTPEARARRVGGRCWRKLRRRSRATTGQPTLFEQRDVVDVHVPGVS